MKRPVRRRRTTDPKGFVVLTEFPDGGCYVTWCKTNSGAAISARPYQSHIIGVSDLLRWHSGGITELERMFALESGGAK